MPSKPQRFVSTRKMPRQERARRTIEVIYEATARIIEREGVGKLTTNHIASRAGVSIGTLYEYFPNKEAVIVAMARRQLADDEQELSTAIVKALATPDTSLVRHVVRSLVALHLRRPRVRRAVMRTHIALGLADEHTAPVQKVAELLSGLSTGAVDVVQRPLLPTEIFVLTRAVLGIVRSAFNEQSDLLHSAIFEEELVRLIEAYLVAKQTAAR